MKKLLLGAAALTMLATACKKKDDGGTPSNSWKVGSTSYTSMATVGASMGSLYTVTASTGNGTSTSLIGFTFSGAAAPAAGTYKVVGSSSPAAGQVVFTAASGSASGTTSYKSTGSDNINATVSVSNGKVSVSMPDTWAKNISGSDSVKVNANITQTQ